MQILTSKTLIIAIGAPGSGKSTAVNKHFPGCVVSSDECRRTMRNGVSDEHFGDIRDLIALEMMHEIIEKRMEQGLLAVADATNVKRKDRTNLRKIAEKHGYKVFYLVFDVDSETCVKRQELRERKVPAYAIEKMVNTLNQNKRLFREENADYIEYYKPSFHVWRNDLAT